MTKEILFFKNQIRSRSRTGSIEGGKSWKYERKTRNKPEAGLSGTKMQQACKCTPGKPENKKETQNLIQTPRGKRKGPHEVV